jgi:NitT/TauT family transport system substrate-binding protein
MALSNRVMNPSICYFWLGMSKKLGWYEEEGVDAQWQGVDGNSLAMQLLTRGSLEMAVGVQDPLLQAASQGRAPELKMFYCSTYAPLYGIAVKPDGPIKDYVDLKGKRIGVLAIGSGDNYYAEQVLKSVQLNPDSDAKFVPLTGAAAAQALYKGSLDAIASFDTGFATIEKVAGFKLRYLPELPLATAARAGNSLASTAAYLKKNQNAAIAMGRVTAKAIIFTQANPQEALRIHFEELFPETKPQTSSISKAIDDLVPGLQARLQKVFPPSGMKLGQFDLDGWKKYAAYLGVPNVDTGHYLTNEFIDRINAFDAGKVRTQARSAT